MTADKLTRWILGVIGSALLALIIFLGNQLAVSQEAQDTRLDYHEKAITQLKVDLGEVKIHQEDTTERLKRIEDKLDQMSDKVARLH